MPEATTHHDWPRPAAIMAAMNLQQLRYLVALADELNFTRAAARCWVSQQAFSKAIAELERRVGVTLVVRRPRGCSLTPAGRRTVATARQILAQTDQLAVLAQQAAEPDTGNRLRVGVLLDGLGRATMPVLAGFRAAMPSVELSVRRIQPHELTGALVDGLVDVALVHGPFADERIDSVPLFTEQRAVVVSAADPRADAAELSADDLLGLPARERRDGIDPGWEGFFTLLAERNCAPPERRGGPAGSLEELLWHISLDRLFLTVPQHLAETYPAATFGVAYVGVPDLPGVVFSVCHRRGDERAAVRRFTALAVAATGPHPTVREHGARA